MFEKIFFIFSVALLAYAIPYYSLIIVNLVRGHRDLFQKNDIIINAILAISLSLLVAFTIWLFFDTSELFLMGGVFLFIVATIRNDTNALIEYINYEEGVDDIDVNTIGCNR